MQNNIIETIEKNVKEMKRMRKSLRSQINELFCTIEDFCEKEEIEIEFEYKGKLFGIEELEFGFQAGHNANGYKYRFINKANPDACQYNNHGFTDDMRAQYISWLNFNNDDVIFLARNIKEILAAMNTKLENKLSELQECQKYLQ